MQTKRSFLYDLRHNNKLPIRIVSPDFGHLTADEASRYKARHQLPYCFCFHDKSQQLHTVGVDTV